MKNPESVLRPCRVVIVEDHPEFREALGQTLSTVPGLELLPPCRDLPAAQALLDLRCPDVMLVDLGLPSGSGLTLIRQAQRRCAGRCTSAVLTVTGNEEHLMTAVGAGAKGYLFKSDQPAAWLDSVRQLACGQSPLHARVAQAMLQRLNPSAEDMTSPLDAITHALLLHVAAGYTLMEAASKLQVSAQDAGHRARQVYNHFQLPVPDLSPRELELLNLLNRGYTFKKCAELMGVGEATTKTQAARAYEKLGATNLQMALYEARLAGFLA